MTSNANENRRNYFRIYFETPLCGSMTISLINEKPVNTGKTRVCIEDISASGLRFFSTIKIPISQNIIIDFKTDILNENKQFSGYVVRKYEVEEDIWEYGIRFVAVERTSSEYLLILNNLAIKMRKKNNIENCSFCTQEEKRECLKLHLIKNKKDATNE